MKSSLKSVPSVITADAKDSSLRADFTTAEEKSREKVFSRFLLRSSKVCAQAKRQWPGGEWYEKFQFIGRA